MAALIALTMPVQPTGVAGMQHAAADGTLPYAVAVVVVWLAVRHQVRPGRPDAAPVSGRLLGALRLGGGLVMLTAMTAMTA